MFINVLINVFITHSCTAGWDGTGRCHRAGAALCPHLALLLRGILVFKGDFQEGGDGISEEQLVTRQG